MTTTLVERLRKWGETPFECGPNIDVMLDDIAQAAALIERQEAVIASQRALLAELELPLSMLITLGTKAGYDMSVTFGLLKRVVAEAKTHVSGAASVDDK